MPCIRSMGVPTPVEDDRDEDLHPGILLLFDQKIMANLVSLQKLVLLCDNLAIR